MLIKKITPITGKLLLKKGLLIEFLQTSGIEFQVSQWVLSKLYIYFCLIEKVEDVKIACVLKR